MCSITEITCCNLEPLYLKHAAIEQLVFYRAANNKPRLLDEMNVIQFAVNDVPLVCVRHGKRFAIAFFRENVIKAKQTT
jgi:hypothetical protein